MGFNTVAVLYNDFDFAKERVLGKRIADAMRGWSIRDRDHLVTHFGCGIVVSQAHADYSQVVVVGQNRGRQIIECNDLDHYAIGQIADALRRHGWDVKPPAKTPRKKSSRVSRPVRK